jgi:hypothetical protein
MVVHLLINVIPYRFTAQFEDGKGDVVALTILMSSLKVSGDSLDLRVRCDELTFPAVIISDEILK